MCLRKADLEIGVVVQKLNYFGNCLVNLNKAGLNDIYTCNTKYITLISGEDFEKVEGDFKLVSKEAKEIKIKNSEFPIEHDKQKYKNSGIEIQNFDNPNDLIDHQSLIRYLDDRTPEVFKATEEELRTSIPGNLPLLLKIDKWHHKSYSEYGGHKPSSYEIYQMIAKVLESKDIAKWKTTLKPNNDWRNWPEAGSL